MKSYKQVRDELPPVIGHFQLLNLEIIMYATLHSFDNKYKKDVRYRIIESEEKQFKIKKSIAYNTKDKVIRSTISSHDNIEVAVQNLFEELEKFNESYKLKDIFR